MKHLSALTLAAVLPTTPLADTHEPISSQPFMAMGAYIPTDNIAISEDFYRVLFDSEPIISLPDFKAFGVAGGWFAVVSRAKYAPGSEPGSGAVPYLQASDLMTLQTRATAAGAPKSNIIKEQGIHLLKVTDPNGQLIEFFKLTSQ